MNVRSAEDVDEIVRLAELSPDGKYRYSLTRRWDDGPYVTWVMLNPSDADHLIDDPTIRRCIGFTRSWGYGALRVVNAYAYRTPFPEAMRTAELAGEDIVGPDNDEYLRETIIGGVLTIVAWGAHALASLRMKDILPQIPGPVAECLGLTQGGHPRHPLYLPKTAVREPWEIPSRWSRG